LRPKKVNIHKIPQLFFYGPFGLKERERE